MTSNLIRIILQKGAFWVLSALGHQELAPPPRLLAVPPGAGVLCHTQASHMRCHTVLSAAEALPRQL